MTLMVGKMAPRLQPDAATGVFSKRFPHVAFRADASLSIGAGHLSRCATLAEAIRHRGGTTTLLCAAGSIQFAPSVTSAMDRIIELPFSGADVSDRSADDWLGHSQAEDAAACRNALSDEPIDWIVADHYGLSAEWEAEIRTTGAKILVIDDLANRPHECDVLLDQNLKRSGIASYSGLVPRNCNVLIGPRYALLRDEFLRTRERFGLRPRTNLRRLLVSFGGVDGANGTSFTLECLSHLCRSDVTVVVVIGGHHPARAEIEMRCRASHFECHVQTTRMAELIESCDLAIGASGASAWERCFLGVPSLMISMAENQIEIAEELARHGAGLNLGTWPEVEEAAIRTAVSSLLQNSEQLSVMSRRTYGIMDPHVDVVDFLLSCDA
jgi:UDP-2,4-diacetamido-2,4,6-trideoxy-beta-L-altropyranose hydrolase